MTLNKFKSLRESNKGKKGRINIFYYTYLKIIFYNISIHKNILLNYSDNNLKITYSIK